MQDDFGVGDAGKKAADGEAVSTKKRATVADDLVEIDAIGLEEGATQKRDGDGEANVPEIGRRGKATLADLVDVKCEFGAHVSVLVFVCDNMAASLMRQGRIQAVIVGADRIAANGDVANKIGTYGVAILAKEHGIPFYVAAPWSTLDLATATGDLIPIEQRSATEVTHSNGRQMTPHGVAIENPAFDVTPAKYVTAIITERGVLRAPYNESIQHMATSAEPQLTPA